MRVVEECSACLPPTGGAAGAGAAGVHVWYLPTDGSDGQRAAARQAEGWLSAGERARADRLHRADDRHRFLLARALARALLSRHADVASGAWRFRAGAHGRPEVAWPAVPLRFSVSHTAGLVACAVARGRAVGLDVEHVPPEAHAREVAAVICTPEERAALDAEASWSDRVAALWTLKEAVVKADGRGLGVLAPHRIAVGGVGAPTVDGAATGWALFARRPTPAHAAGLCVGPAECGHERPLAP